MAKRKQRNPVNLKNVHRNNVVTQSVKVVVAAPKPKKRTAITAKLSQREKHMMEREQAVQEKLSLAQRLPSAQAGHSLFSKLAEKEVDKIEELKRGILRHLSTLRGEEPKPATAEPRLGDVAKSPTKSETEGIGQYIVGRVASPARSDSIYNSPVGSPSITPGTRLLQDKEKLRRWLYANVTNLPSSAKYNTTEKQSQRVDDLKSTDAIIKLYHDAKEYIKRHKLKERYPEGMTPADFRKYHDSSGNRLAASGGGGRSLFTDSPGEA